MSGQNMGTETLVAAFNDHLAVVVRIAFKATTLRRGRAYWRTNTALLNDKTFQVQLRRRWAEWTKETKNYHTMVL
jgi:hypothetical protein